MRKRSQQLSFAYRHVCKKCGQPIRDEQVMVTVTSPTHLAGEYHNKPGCYPNYDKATLRLPCLSSAGR